MWRPGDSRTDTRLLLLTQADARAAKALADVDALLARIRDNAAELHQHVRRVLAALRLV
jgi:hypothetical protein